MTSLSCVIFLFYLDDKRKGHPQCMLCPILAEICTEQVWRWWFLYCSLPLFINLGKTKPLNFKEIFFNCICVICSARAFAHNLVYMWIKYRKKIVHMNVHSSQYSGGSVFLVGQLCRYNLMYTISHKLFLLFNFSSSVLICSRQKYIS